jgi:hypothetical protein
MHCLCLVGAKSRYTITERPSPTWSNINEAITLALPGLSPPTTNNTSGDDGNASIHEQSTETSIINVETKVGDEQHRFGRLANRIFASRARRTRYFRFSGTAGFLFSVRDRICRCVPFLGLALGLALERCINLGIENEWLE